MTPPTRPHVRRPLALALRYPPPSLVSDVSVESPQHRSSLRFYEILTCSFRIRTCQNVMCQEPRKPGVMRAALDPRPTIAMFFAEQNGDRTRGHGREGMVGLALRGG